MSFFRFLTLTLGPLGIIGALYALTMPDALQGAIPWTPSPAAAGVSETAEPPLIADESKPAVITEPAVEGLEALCEQRAAELDAQLGTGCRVLVRPPYVIAGDLSEADLDRYHTNVIRPVERALFTSYFDARPDQPIAVLMFAALESYERYALRLDGRRPSRYSGYYLRGERRIILNLATGVGTLAHELTHALAHFDFPDMPEWFDEGLAALHEESVFSEDGLQLRGQHNWRLNHLREAVRRGHLQSLDELVSRGGVRPGSEAVDYAHARSFCLYLQERQLLGAFYRKLRARTPFDPTGHETLCELFHVQTLDPVERGFLDWVKRLNVRAAGARRERQ